MFGWIGALIFGGKSIKALCEKELPAEYHGNWRAEQVDADKVRFGEMSKREFIHNMNSGKYYAPTSSSLNKREYMHWLSSRSRNMMNLEADFGEFNFIKQMTPKEAKEKYIELLNQK